MSSKFARKLTLSTPTDDRSFVRDETLTVNIFCWHFDTATVSWAYFRSLPVPSEQAFTSWREHTREPVVVLNSETCVSSAKKTLFSAVSRSLSPFALKRASCKWLASSTSQGIVCNSRSFHSTGPVSTCISRVSFEIFTEQSDRSIERPMSSSSLIFVMASANVTFCSKLALTRLCRARTCFWNQAKIKFLSQDHFDTICFRDLHIANQDIHILGRRLLPNNDLLGMILFNTFQKLFVPRNGYCLHRLQFRHTYLCFVLLSH